MQTHNHKHIESEALARYLCGEMSEQESHAFETELPALGENKTSIEKMKKQWSAINEYPQPKVPDTKKAWQKLSSRLENEKLIPVHAEAARRIAVPKLIRIAAILITVLGISAILYTSVNRKPTVEMVQLNTQYETNTLIKTLNDGSVIYIAHNSMFSFPTEFNNESRNVALKGEAFFDIAPNPAKPFIIETEQARIEVLGTAFNVKTSEDHAFELCVDRGKVKVTLKNDPSHPELVLAGEKVTSVNHNLVKSKNADRDLWYKNRMHFKDEALGNIVSVLNRNFNTTFVVPGKETAGRKLTVTFDHETEATMTELICTTLNLKSQTINGSVVLSEKNDTPKN